MTRRLSSPIMGTVLLLVLAAAASILAVLTPRAPEIGPSTYSRSAIGHAALLELLHRTQIPANVSIGASGAKVRQGGLLILAEPNALPGNAASIADLLSARNVLLILPKWFGTRDDHRPDWVGRLDRLPNLTVQAVLDDALPSASTADIGDHTHFTVNKLGPVPATPVQNWQIMHFSAGAPTDKKGAADKDDKIDTIVADHDNILIARIRRHRRHHAGGSDDQSLWILTDPDVISNHGLATGNAALAIALIDQARNGGPVIFDETIHGYDAASHGGLRLAFTAPFLPVTVSLLLFGLLAIAANRASFGAKLDPPAPLSTGPLTLITTVAGLLDDGGHHGALIARYADAAIHDAMRSLQPGLRRTQAPAATSPVKPTDIGAPTAQIAAALAEAETRRGLALHAADLWRDAINLAGTSHPPARDIQALALRIHQWKQEILHDPR